MSHRIKKIKKMGTEAKRLSIKKPESWVSNHKKGKLGFRIGPWRHQED